MAIGQCSAFVSMKFHGTVVASMYGIPSIILSATDKNLNFSRLLERPDLVSSFKDKYLHKNLHMSLSGSIARSGICSGIMPGVVMML